MLPTKLYVANNGDNTISVIDGRTNQVINTIKVGNNPSGVSVNPNTNIIYVTNYDDNTVSVINGKTNQVVPNINVGNSFLVFLLIQIPTWFM